jgi:Lipase (class 3)
MGALKKLVVVSAVPNDRRLSETRFSTPEFAEMLHLTNDRGMISQRVVAHRGRQGADVVKSKPDVVNLRPSRILVLDDEFEVEELVFAVEVSYLCKRITVTFRGTETKKDWAIDTEIWMREVPNPVAKHSTQSPTVRVHHGFFKYLFEPSTRGRVKGPGGEALSQFQEILQLHVRPILKQYPGYKVCANSRCHCRLRFIRFARFSRQLVATNETLNVS